MDKLRLNLIELINIHIGREEEADQVDIDIREIKKNNPNIIVDKYIDHT